MGYTHYWKINKKIGEKEYERFISAVIDIFEATLTPLSDVSNLTTGIVRCNGVGEDSHETFYFKNEPTEFSFCKTERKPYDEVVTAVLIAAKIYFEDNIEISSDGGLEHWMDGRLLVVSTFPSLKDRDLIGRLDPFKLKEEGPINQFISPYL